MQDFNWGSFRILIISGILYLRQLLLFDTIVRGWLSSNSVEDCDALH